MFATEATIRVDTSTAENEWDQTFKVCIVFVTSITLFDIQGTKCSMCIRIELLDIFHLNEIRNIGIISTYIWQTLVVIVYLIQTIGIFLWWEILIYSLCLLCETRLTKRKAEATILYIPLINLSCHNSTTHIQGEK